ncbi:MAG: hypothetical protein E6767_08470 [Dysgonomonas sp.]|nr:hypothetical protein [Dysgonomonas sp.]
MVKRFVKIVILFVLIILVLLGGWRMFNSLERNKQFFSENIYNYVSPEAVEIISINKKYKSGDLLLYDTDLYDLIPIDKDFLLSPVIITKDKKENRVLLAKIKYEDQQEILYFIKNYVAAPIREKNTRYKNTDIYTYSLQDGRFLSCTFYKGIFVASRSYKSIKSFIDTDTENSFFKNYEIEHIDKQSPIDIYIKVDNNVFVLDYAKDNDTIKFTGHIYDTPSRKFDSIKIGYEYLPYFIPLHDSLCIDKIDIMNENYPPEVKIVLNKIY